MAPKYPSIPEPTLKVESLRDAVLTLKQAFEVLTGQRGNQDYRAVLLPELTAAVNAFDARIDAIDTALATLTAGALRFDIAQSLTGGQVERALMNVHLGRATNIGSTDLDNLQTPGLYDGSNLGHSPDGTANWFYIEVWFHSGYVPTSNDWMIQRATHLTDAASTACYIRLNVGGGAWGAWKRYTLV